MGSPTASIRYGGEYGTLCRITVGPAHLMPVVVMIRWSMIEIASAPPSQSALTTAWMSCWWTTSVSPGGSPSSAAWSSTSCGASCRVTVTPGPETGRSPEGPRSSSTRRWSLVTWVSPTPRESLLTSLLSAASRCWSASVSVRCPRTSVLRSVTLAARRSLPWASIELVTNSPPATAKAPIASHGQGRRAVRRSR